MNPEERAFLRAIWKKPSDLTTRLVYADWLQEHEYDWDARAVRYWCGLTAQDHAALKLVITFRKLGYRTAYIGPPDLPIPPVSPEYVFGSLDRRQIQEFPRAPGKGRGPGWERYRESMLRLCGYG